jgi:hypothetical protein
MQPADVLPVANAMYDAFIIRYYRVADRMFSVYRPSRKQWTGYFPVTGLENRYLQFVAEKQIESTFLKFLKRDIINYINIRDIKFLQRSC